MNALVQALERQELVVRPAQAPVGRALPTELTVRGRSQLKVASAAVRRVEQDTLAQSGCQRARSDAAPAYCMHRLAD
jgi:hypothetical protein